MRSFIPKSVVPRTRSTLFPIEIRKLYGTILTFPSNQVEDLPKRTGKTLVLLQIKVVREVASNTSSGIDCIGKMPRSRVALTYFGCCVVEWAAPAGLAFSVSNKVVERTFVTSIVIGEGIRWRTRTVVDTDVIGLAWRADNWLAVMNGQVVGKAMRTSVALFGSIVKSIREIACLTRSIV